MSAYCYIRSEPDLYTVGTYASGEWVPESDHSSTKDAAARVNYLNGGSASQDFIASLADALEAASFALMRAGPHVPDNIRDEHTQAADKVYAALKLAAEF